MRNNVSIERIKYLLSYDEKTGLLTWNVDRHARKVKGKAAGWITKSKGHKTAYVNIRIDGFLFKAHRVAWLIHYGLWPDYIDHIDGEGTNNKIENLRSVSMAENMKNKPLQENNTSGISGVSYVKKRGKWIARISDNGRRIVLGFFVDFSDAVNARKHAENELKYHKNHGR